MLAFQVCFQVGKRCDFTVHCPSDHRIHEPGQALWFIMQYERYASGVSNGFKSIYTCWSRGAGGNLKLDQFIRLALDDFVVTINAPTTWPFQSLFESC